MGINNVLHILEWFRRKNFVDCSGLKKNKFIGFNDIDVLHVYEGEKTFDVVRKIFNYKKIYSIQLGVSVVPVTTKQTGKV